MADSPSLAQSDSSRHNGTRPHGPAPPAGKARTAVRGVRRLHLLRNEPKPQLRTAPLSSPERTHEPATPGLAERTRAACSASLSRTNPSAAPRNEPEPSQPLHHELRRVLAA